MPNQTNLSMRRAVHISDAIIELFDNGGQGTHALWQHLRGVFGDISETEFTAALSITPAKARAAFNHSEGAPS